MKKILFATTALVATASVAAADVTFSGYGRFGVKYTGSVAAKAKVDGVISAAEVTGFATANTAYNTKYSASRTVTAADTAVTDAEAGTLEKALEAQRTAATQARNAAIAADYKALVSTDDLEALATTAATSATASAAANAAAQEAALAALIEARLASSNAQIAAAAAKAVADVDKAIAATAAAASGSTDLAAQQAADLLALLEAETAAARGTSAVEAIASDTLITSRLRMNIDASTESDSGVSFGVRVRLQQSDGANNAFNSARFYAKSGGLELGVGNIYGVIDNMAGLYSGSVGLTGLGYANVVSNFGSLAYSSTGTGSASTGEAAEIIYTMGDYGFAVATDGTDTEYGVSATMSGWTVALSASDTDTAANSEWVATVGGSIGGVTVGLATAEAVSGDTSTTLSAKFDVAAATSVTVYYNDDEANTVDDKSYGLGFSHGLGGGTSLQGGIVSVNDRTSADFGVLFNF